MSGLFIKEDEEEDQDDEGGRWCQTATLAEDGTKWHNICQGGEILSAIRGQLSPLPLSAFKRVWNCWK